MKIKKKIRKPRSGCIFPFSFISDPDLLHADSADVFLPYEKLRFFFIKDKTEIFIKVLFWSKLEHWSIQQQLFAALLFHYFCKLDFYSATRKMSGGI